MRKFLVVSGLAAMASASPSSAVSLIFSGQDDGAPVGGPFPSSAAAEAAFKAAAAAYGSVATETFEGATVGDLSPVSLARLTITTDAADYGPDFSGVNDTTLGNVYGFNTTPGGEKWYGFPDFVATSATFEFNGSTNSMGLWITGVQTGFTASIVVELLDGSMESLDVPLNVDGGAQFYGVVSDTAFTRVLVLQTSNPGFSDLFGIDDISFNVVPEPATWAMLIAGFGLVGASVRRRRALAA